MNGKKTSVILTAQNNEKVEAIVRESGLSKTAVINDMIAGTPIIYLGQRKTIAECFFDIRNMLEEGGIDDVREEVMELCQSLNSLMEKIVEMRP